MEHVHAWAPLYSEPAIWKCPGPKSHPQNLIKIPFHKTVHQSLGLMYQFRHQSPPQYWLPLLVHPQLRELVITRATWPNRLLTLSRMHREINPWRAGGINRIQKDVPPLINIHSLIWACISLCIFTGWALVSILFFLSSDNRIFYYPVYRSTCSSRPKLILFSKIHCTHYTHIN